MNKKLTQIDIYIMVNSNYDSTNHKKTNALKLYLPTNIFTQ